MPWDRGICDSLGAGNRFHHHHGDGGTIVIKNTQMFINKVILYGNITKKPEIKALLSGSYVCNFSVATNRTYKDKDGQKQTSAEFHNIVAFGKTAELIDQYMDKGSGIYVEGRIQTRSWEAKDGTKRYTTEIVVESMQFGPKSGKSGESGEESGWRPYPKSEPTTDNAEEGTKEPPVNLEDLPF
jgi:single-strand DNA-binding protein